MYRRWSAASARARELTLVCCLVALTLPLVPLPGLELAGIGLATAHAEDGAQPAREEVARGDAPTPYETGVASPYGIGKFYQGREIAKVMSHLGADWLERPERTTEENPDEMIEALPLARDAIVADIGAGSGYLSFKLSKRVPEGKVLAVDIQPEMLERLVTARDERGISNVQTIVGSIEDPRLPDDAVDLALMVDAYHEFSHPREMMLALRRALRTGGMVALVEYRAEDESVPILPTHKMSQEQVKKEMAAVGLTYVRTYDGLPQQHLMLFTKSPE